MEMLWFVVSILAVIVFGVFGLKRGYQEMLIVLPLLFPAYLIRLNLGVEFNLLELLIYEIAVFAIWQNRGQLGNVTKIFQEEINLLVGLFLVAGIGSLIMAPTSFSLWKELILAPIIYWFLLRSVSPLSFSRKKILDLMLVSGIVIAISIIIQSLISGVRDSEGRVFYLAALLVYVLVVIEQSELKKSLFERFLITMRKVLKFSMSEISIYFYWSALVILIVAIVMSESRLVGVSIFVGFFFYYLFRDRHFNLEKILAIMAGAVLLVGLVSYQIKSDYAADAKALLGKSFSVRSEVWQVATRILQEHWVLGVGFNQFDAYYIDLAPTILFRQPILAMVSSPLNVILELWLNLGILGIVSFVALVVITLRQIFRAQRLENHQNLVVLAAMLSALLINAFWITPFLRQDVLLEFWTMLALFWHRQGS